LLDASRSQDGTVVGARRDERDRRPPSKTPNRSLPKALADFNPRKFCESGKRTTPLKDMTVMISANKPAGNASRRLTAIEFSAMKLPRCRCNDDGRLSGNLKNEEI
jgi:hypothetical protein